MLPKVLKSLGLSEKEATVYLASLSLNSSKISTIAKKAGLSRSTTYNILSQLYGKGLVRRTHKAGVQYFSPVPPLDLIEYLEKQKEETTNKIDMVKTYLPQFEKVCNPELNLPKVTFYEGVNGVKQIYDDILKNGNKQTYAALSLDNIAPEIKNWLIKKFTPKKIKKNIDSKVLLSSKGIKSYLKLSKKHKRKTAVIPSSKFPFEVEIDVYDNNKTAFISYDEKEMMGVIIESDKIAKTMQSIFNLIWKEYKGK